MSEIERDILVLEKGPASEKTSSPAASSIWPAPFTKTTAGSLPPTGR